MIKQKTYIPNLHEYEILTEVPLSTSGGFMKADIMLVKRTSDKAGIEDIVIIENKLSSGTDLTERQLEGFAQISKTGTITAREAKAGYWNGQYEFKNLREKCVKLFDHGKDDVQVVEASMIKIQ